VSAPHGIRVSTVNVSTPDPAALAAFYCRLLGWEVAASEPDWVLIAGPETIRLSFERDVNYQPPVWPTEPGRPPMMLHLEVRVTDLPGALEHARACGARLAAVQPQDDVRVCLDPDGHPFCLWLDETGD
jgi:catechol 2,3-dioxygenase-like lactoylglutathione lyase family enzyme